jgi:hypothetical protein
VSWRWTASSSTVESRARRVLLESTPEVLITSRTASKMRCGRFDARSLLRHNTSTVGWKASSPIPRPQATFQEMLVSSWRQASLSDSPSRACSTMTVAITSASTEGLPRSDGNRSANMSSGNSFWRCSAKKAYTEPCLT